ncbi:hypothetical protein NOR_07647 [Metarhizium rileyi]|uniref:U4/U6.U5 small nuclear ribonucleoprotein 27kDa protein domain-containing protein n=1 Tax=Metarhizium rileyi (strain RCEF 4871) TaxID=1649241 RepID=A0A166XXJ0_METRR|nr:hypothetical protein NOR_07647 [Metarhizium rileyi RCEF 4871]TWU72095.1 hypothetical protein ED733_000746 [Metarhizium rileyi]
MSDSRRSRRPDSRQMWNDSDRPHRRDRDRPDRERERDPDRPRRRSRSWDRRRGNDDRSRSPDRRYRDRGSRGRGRGGRGRSPRGSRRYDDREPDRRDARRRSASPESTSPPPSSSLPTRSRPDQSPNTAPSRRRSPPPRDQSRGDTPMANEDDAQTGGLDADDDISAMQAMMGFGGFGTTKNKKVAGNNAGAVRKEKKVEYRQYMNRQGGFNRPLSPGR